MKSGANKYSGSVYPDFMERLKQIYAAMDQTYNTAAGHYGFACAGCRDNCCRTRFYHHTVIEYTYFIEGLKTLTPLKQDEVKSRAMTVVDKTANVDDLTEPVRLMCPLNFDELCILYPYRPMICRLHGIPHELKKPGQFMPRDVKHLTIAVAAWAISSLIARRFIENWRSWSRKLSRRWGLPQSLR
jgi:Fe-S-cluster containining protein